MIVKLAMNNTKSDAMSAQVNNQCDSVSNFC